MTDRLAEEGRLAWTALTVLTRLPAPRLTGFRPDWLPRSVPYFPFVGLLVGLVAATVYSLAALLWAEPVASVLTVAATAWVTGGLHEDGWADACDGLGAGGDRERILAIMKDSYIGAFGAVGLTCLIVARVAGLSTLPAGQVPGSLAAAHVLSRWSSLPLLLWLPSLRPTGMAAPFAGRVTRGRVAVGTIAAAVLIAAALGRMAVTAWVAAGIATAAAGLLFRRRLGGITGDCLGAANQLVELSVVLALAACLPRTP